MLASKLNFGIPDVDLTWSCGGTVNPSCFAGHQLVVLFLPTDPERQAAELSSYEKHADDFAGSDAWFLVIGTAPPEGRKKYATPITFDHDDIAWHGFTTLERPDHSALSRQDGAVFLFTRGGGLQRVWAGAGHADRVVRQLKENAWLATPMTSRELPISTALPRNSKRVQSR